MKFQSGFLFVVLSFCLLIASSITKKPPNAVVTYGHKISVVNLTDFLYDLSRRLRFVIKAYRLNTANRNVTDVLKTSSFVVAKEASNNKDKPEQSYQALLYVIAVLLCYAAAICAMVVFNQKERRSQAKYEAYEDVIKQPRNYLYHYFREKYKDPDSVKAIKKKSSTVVIDGDSSGTSVAIKSSVCQNSPPLEQGPSNTLLFNSKSQPPLSLKISMCSDDIPATAGSSPTISMSSDLTFTNMTSANSLKKKNSTPLVENVTLLSPTVEEAMDSAAEEDIAASRVNERRFKYASQGHAGYSYGGDYIRRSPYLVVNNFNESFSSSVSNTGNEEAEMDFLTEPRSARMISSTSDCSSFARESLHSFTWVQDEI